LKEGEINATMVIVIITSIMEQLFISY
jgi:hypothetical protein